MSLQADSFHAEVINKLDMDYLRPAIRELRTAYGVVEDFAPLIPLTTTDHTNSTDIDPSQPTIGIAHSSFSGQEFLGITAARLREAGEDAPNVVILFPWAAHDLEARHAKLWANHGATLNAAGKICIGHFDAPVRIDFVLSDPFNEESKAILESHNIPVAMDAETYTEMGDKAKAKKLLAGQVPFIPSIGFESDRRPTAIKLALFTKQNSPGGIVVKPKRGARGMGVKFFAGDELNAAVAHANTLIDDGNGVIVEALKEPIPIIDDNLRMKHWNLRGIGGGGNYFGSYARVAAEGGPINFALGATEHSFDWIMKKLEQIGVDREDAERVVTEFHRGLGHQALYGSDLSITMKGEVVAYEINYGNFGGLENVVQYEPTFEDKMTVTSNILRHITSLIPTDLLADTLEPETLVHSALEELSYRINCNEEPSDADIETAYNELNLLHDAGEDKNDLWCAFFDMVGRSGSPLKHSMMMAALEQLTNGASLETHTLKFIAQLPAARIGGLSERVVRQFIDHYPNSKIGHELLTEMLIDDMRYIDFADALKVAHRHPDFDTENVIKNRMIRSFFEGDDRLVELKIKHPDLTELEKFEGPYADEFMEILKSYEPVMMMLAAVAEDDPLVPFAGMWRRSRGTWMSDVPYVCEIMCEIGMQWAVSAGEWGIASRFMKQYDIYNSNDSTVMEQLINAYELGKFDDYKNQRKSRAFLADIYLLNGDFDGLYNLYEDGATHPKVRRHITEKLADKMQVPRKKLQPIMHKLLAGDFETALEAARTLQAKLPTGNRLDVIQLFCASKLRNYDLFNELVDAIVDDDPWNVTIERLYTEPSTG